MQIKEMICEIGRRMYQKNFVAANDGNISAKLEDGSIWVTPTGVSKGFMTPDMLVRVDKSLNILEGSRRPSSEMKMHLRVYQENPEVRAVVHAHPLVATSFAVAGLPLNAPISAEPLVLLGEVPVAAYATPGTQEVPDSIAPFCKTHCAVLLANHGALTWGKDLTQAYYRMESLEHYANMRMYTKYILKQSNYLTEKQIEDLVSIRKGIDVQY